MASYLSVISNDTLSHKALSGSPETLCGKLVIDSRSPREIPELDTTKFTPLACDICETLSGGGSFIKENIAKITEAGRDCPHCVDGFDASGNMCWNCGGSGWLSEGDDIDDYYSDLSGLDLDDLKGTKVASTDKTATNWTRDGVPIEDGLTITVEQAARTPFLDYTRVAVSERRECPDCHTQQWVSKIAGCDTCGLLKCNSCMESIGPSQFMGMCKTCASAESDLAYETEYEDPYQGGSLYLNYLMSEDEGETDPLFLPSNPD